MFSSLGPFPPFSRQLLVGGMHHFVVFLRVRCTVRRWGFLSPARATVGSLASKRLGIWSYLDGLRR